MVWVAGCGSGFKLMPVRNPAGGTDPGSNRTRVRQPPRQRNPPVSRRTVPGRQGTRKACTPPRQAATTGM